MPVNTGSIVGLGAGRIPTRTVASLVRDNRGKREADPIVDKMAFNALSEFRQSMKQEDEAVGVCSTSRTSSFGNSGPGQGFL